MNYAEPYKKALIVKSDLQKKMNGFTRKGRSKSFHNVKWGVVITLLFSLPPPSELTVFVRLKASRD